MGAISGQVEADAWRCGLWASICNARSPLRCAELSAKRAVFIPGKQTGYGLVCAPADAGHAAGFFSPPGFGVKGFRTRTESRFARFLLGAGRPLPERLGLVRPERVQNDGYTSRSSAYINSVSFCPKYSVPFVSVDLRIALQKSLATNRVKESRGLSRMQPSLPPTPSLIKRMFFGISVKSFQFDGAQERLGHSHKPESYLKDMVPA